MDEYQRNSTLGAIARKIGGEAALVLFNLIEAFPDRLVHIDGQAWMRADLGASNKLHMDSIKYYELINALIGDGWIAELIDDNKRHFYKINFERLEEFKPQEEPVTYEVIDD